MEKSKHSVCLVETESVPSAQLRWWQAATLYNMHSIQIGTGPQTRHLVDRTTGRIAADIDPIDSGAQCTRVKKVDPSRNLSSYRM